MGILTFIIILIFTKFDRILSECFVQMSSAINGVDLTLRSSLLRAINNHLYLFKRVYVIPRDVLKINAKPKHVSPAHVMHSVYGAVTCWRSSLFIVMPQALINSVSPPFETKTLPDIPAELCRNFISTPKYDFALIGQSAGSLTLDGWTDRGAVMSERERERRLSSDPCHPRHNLGDIFMYPPHL